MSGFGTVLPAVTIGLGAIAFRPKRGFFPYNDEGEALAPIIAQATIEERHVDRLHATEHPVEMGAQIADHAYKEAADVVIRCGWSNSPSGPGSLVGQAVGLGTAVFGGGASILASVPSTIKAVQSLLAGDDQQQTKAIYNRLLQLQSDRIPFDVFTGKRVYRQMLLISLVLVTNETSENSLPIEVHCRQILIAETSTVSVPSNPAAMADPAATGPTKDKGKVALEPAAAMTPDPQTLTGAMTEASDAMVPVQNSLDPVSGLEGALGRVSGVVGAVQEAIIAAQATLPGPFQIPFDPATGQIFGISLGLPDLTGIQLDVLETAKATAAEAHQTLTEAIQEVPLFENLPAGLAEQMSFAKEKLGGALSQFTRILH